MKRTKIYFLVISSLLFGEYLQEGAYPECSYIIVTEDGWRVHKNYEGRVLSMKAPKTHNDKIGKYSFNEYGNLVEFSQCTTKEMLSKKIENHVSVNTNTDKKIKFNFDFSNFSFKNIVKLVSKPSLSVNGGLINTLKFSDLYPIGYHYGLDLNFNKLSVLLLGFNIANVGPSAQMLGYNDDGSQPSLTGNGLLIGYELDWKNFYLRPALGLVKTEGETLSGLNVSGTDKLLKTDLGLYLGKSKNISLYGSGTLSLTEIGRPGKALYLNMGIKYNF